VIEPDPDVECGYLVKHEKGTGVFCWAQHAFKVLADKKEGIYKCECMQWEHTGLFCMHVIKAFTHLQVQSIPEKYILRRYTRNARSVVPWDRHDVRVATHADTEQTRMSKLLPKLMRLCRAGSKSDRAYAETVRHIDMITPGIELLQTAETAACEMESGDLHENGDNEMGLVCVRPTDESGDATVETAINPINPATPKINHVPGSATTLGGVIVTEPPVSSTKGRKPVSAAKSSKNIMIPDNPYSTYSGGKGVKECQTCHVRGHYSTTCPQNPNRSKAAENKAKKRGAKTEGWAQRKRGRPRVKNGQNGDQEGQSEADETQKSECSVVLQQSQAHGAIARIRRATSRDVDYRDDYESE
jgi:hypothetical protein